MLHHCLWWNVEPTLQAGAHQLTTPSGVYAVKRHGVWHHGNDAVELLDGSRIDTALAVASVVRLARLGARITQRVVLSGVVGGHEQGAFPHSTDRPAKVLAGLGVVAGLHVEYAVFAVWHLPSLSQ